MARSKRTLIDTADSALAFKADDPLQFLNHLFWR